MTDKNSSSLQFVVVERPSDTKRAGYRRKVRSHVATTQHRRAREASSTKATLHFVQGNDGRRSKRKLDKDRLTGSTSSSSATTSTAGEEYQAQEISPQDAARQELPRRTTAAALQTCGAGGMFATGAMYLRTIALDDADNDVGMVLNSLRCNVTTVWVCSADYPMLPRCIS